jgi:plastocyanin
MKWHSKLTIVAAGSLLLAVGLVACDDDDPLDDDIPANGDETTTVETPSGGSGDDGTGTPQGGSGDEIVEVSDDAPSQSISVSPGASVTFVNSTDDTITVAINGTDESGELEPGDSFDFTFDEVGEYLVTAAGVPSFLATVTVS